MTKEEFLSKLSHEELIILKDIMSCEITREINKREVPKKNLDVKVGNCFIYKADPDAVYLVKITAEEGAGWFTCDEISIDNHDIDCYDVSYHIDEYGDWEPLDSNVYDKIYTLIETRNEAVNKIVEQFDKQIRELCLISLNIQNKNLKI